MRSTPSTASTCASSSRERGALLARQVTTVGVDVLTEQRDLAHTVAGESLHLGHELVRRAADLATAGGRHDAVRAHAVAADADLHPRVVIARSLGGQVPGEPFEFEIPLRGERVADQELSELVDLTGPERDVHEREPREHLLLDRLRPASADTDDHIGTLGLHPLGLAEVRHEPAVGLLPDRARVEQDQVGLVAHRRLGVPERFQHPLHPFGVVLVHLTPERGYVVQPHRRQGYRGGPVAPPAASASAAFGPTPGSVVIAPARGRAAARATA